MPSWAHCLGGLLPPSQASWFHMAPSSTPTHGMLLQNCRSGANTPRAPPEQPTPTQYLPVREVPGSVLS